MGHSGRSEEVHSKEAREEMRFIYLNQDGETTGPFTGQEVREAIAELKIRK